MTGASTNHKQLTVKKNLNFMIDCVKVPSVKTQIPRFLPAYMKNLDLIRLVLYLGCTKIQLLHNPAVLLG